MAITRRQFLQRSGMIAAGATLGPSLFRNGLVRDALASTIGDRYFVVIFLDGGNDGLNTVIPYDDGGGSLRSDYDAARSSINISPGQLDAAGTVLSGGPASGLDPNTGAQLALHPAFGGSGGGMGGFKALWDEGRLAIVQGCGYPEYSLSHEESRLIWESANPLDVGPFAGSGWVGRFLADQSQYGGGDIPGVSLNGRIAGELRQSRTSVLAVRRLRDFGFPYDDYANPSDLSAKRAAFQALQQEAAAACAMPPCAGASGIIGYIGSSAGATLLSAESYPLLHSLYETDRPAENASYAAVEDGITGTGRDLREVAKVIYGVASGQPNVHARFFQLRNGGYDTHSDQGGAAATGQHYRLHKEVGDAVRIFFKDLETMPGNVAAKTTVLIWSEFGRRIRQNDNGTDHGSQAPMFVIGGAVNGGVYGNHPNIAKSDQDTQGNTVYRQHAGHAFRSTDFRDVYGTILKHWLNMPESTILAGVLPVDAGDPASYWTAPSFDLGFLP